MAKKTISLILVFCLPFWIFGGVDLDGVNDEITTGVAISSFITASAGTMAVWVKPTGTPVSTTRYDFGEQLMGDTEMYISIGRSVINGNDRITCGNWDGSPTVIEITYTADEWVHIVWRHTGGTLYGYKNGVEVSSVASGNTTTLTNPLIFGHNNFQSLWDDFDISDAAVWNVALTPNEIEILGKSKVKGMPLQIKPSALTGYWPFDDEEDGTSFDTDTAVDRSGNGRDGTGVGGTAQAEEVLSYPQ